MNPIQTNANPFFLMVSILDACNERSAFLDEELSMIAEAKAFMNLVGNIAENVINETANINTPEQLELPLYD